MDKNKLGMTSGNVNEFSTSYGSGWYNSQDSDQDGYPELLEAMKQRFSAAVAQGKKLYTTNATGLYNAYLDGVPPHTRHHYVCRSCEKFIEDFGGLVTISDKGIVESVLWNINDAPDFFIKSVGVMHGIAKNSRVTGVFIPETKTLGQPKTGTWTHFAVDVPKPLVHKSKVETAFQAEAKLKQDYQTLNNAITNFTFNTVEQAVHLIRSGNMKLTEKVQGVAEWFYNLRSKLNSTHGFQAKQNIVWKAVAGAPTGFCHIPSSSYGKLLADIQIGLSFEDIHRSHLDREDPLKKLRPQAAPKAGTIARAEKIVQTLKSAGALSRRFARKDELNLLWGPRLVTKTAATSTGTSVFSHLQPKETRVTKTSMVMPATTMTWEKFAKTVLHHAQEIEYLVKAGKDNYSAILTATNMDAPPILQWDNEEQRNPFSHYVYHSGSYHDSWNLPTGYVKVTGITLAPSMWYGNYPHQGKSVSLLLEGAKDTKFRGAGNALFPSILKSEYHEIRSVIESYSKGEDIQGYHQASACGILLQGGNSWNAQVRVTTKTGVTVYKLDRWD